MHWLLKDHFCGVYLRDDVKAERDRQCAQTSGFLGITDPIYCNDASMGHPNYEDAERYAKRILTTLFPPSPDPCQPIVNEINSLKNELGILQRYLGEASTGQKHALVKIIHALNTEIKTRNLELNQCRINNLQIPPIIN